MAQRASPLTYALCTSMCPHDGQPRGNLRGRCSAPYIFCCRRVGWCVAGTVRVAPGLLSYPTSSRMLGNISSLRELGWCGTYPKSRMG